MAKVYKSFRELVEQNRALFDLFDRRHRNLCRSVWESRQGEVEGLERTLADQGRRVEAMESQLADLRHALAEARGDVAESRELGAAQEKTIAGQNRRH